MAHKTRHFIDTTFFFSLSYIYVLKKYSSHSDDADDNLIKVSHSFMALNR